MDELETALRSLGPWHFDVDLGNSRRTVEGNSSDGPRRVSVIDPHELEPLLLKIYPGGLDGRSFLDVACNGGGYSVVAQRLGASRTFGFDSREHWVSQARFIAAHLGLETARFEQKALHEVDLSEGYDVALFKGILYHLPDPVHALQQVCDITREIVIVDTETDGDRGDLCFQLNAEGTTSLMTGMHGLAWWPSGPDLLAVILTQLGFPEVREIFWRAKNPQRVKGRMQPGRCRIIAARTPEVLARYDVLPGARKDRPLTAAGGVLQPGE